ncbi:MAG TPA: hypothetical protein VI731_06745 [Bacteroidia bacterium]|nr:hypothetical protein [Bacteroidia bacterium]
MKVIIGATLFFIALIGCRKEKLRMTFIVKPCAMGYTEHFESVKLYYHKSGSSSDGYNFFPMEDMTFEGNLTEGEQNIFLKEGMYFLTATFKAIQTNGELLSSGKVWTYFYIDHNGELSLCDVGRSRTLPPPEHVGSSTWKLFK